jgi:hypothetical protein
MEPEIEYFTVFAITNNAEGSVRLLGSPKSTAKAA